MAAATALIMNGDGSIEKITTRAIAEQAGVGLGLVNYHFQNKDRLIELCVQRIIAGVIGGFEPPLKSGSGSERLKATAKAVFDFLMENPAVSRISILGDFRAPQAEDNTMRTAAGFLATAGVDSPEYRAAAFALTSTMQGAFLRREAGKSCMGYDIRIKEERDACIDFLADALFGEAGKLTAEKGGADHEGTE